MRRKNRMKLTKSKLREIIREEIQKLNEIRLTEKLSKDVLDYLVKTAGEETLYQPGKNDPKENLRYNINWAIKNGISTKGFKIKNNSQTHKEVMKGILKKYPKIRRGLKK
jgi:hypothetical protein